MLKNYFKIAIAVLKRKKFFTFISLFGISFTLTILMVATAFVDKVANDRYPDKKRDRLLFVNRMEKRGKENMNSGPVSFYFVDHFLRTMKTPRKVAFATLFSSTNTYVNDRKIAVNFKHTDAFYWEVLDYEFVEGKPYTKQQVAAGERLAVISEDMKRDYFGTGTEPATGKTMEVDNLDYRVCGVVKNVPITSYQFYADMYIPYTAAKSDFSKDRDYGGGALGILMGDSADDMPRMQAEFYAMVGKLPVPEGFDKIYTDALPYIESYVNTGNHNDSGMLIAVLMFSGFMLFIMLLPTLNLVNINITRIMERSSEIGVRKAFGASSRTLIYQFLVENLILTGLGGLIGIVLSVIALGLINSAGFIANLDLTLNFSVLGYALLICLVFGVLSGVYPAWRMSKLHIVSALKAN